LNKDRLLCINLCLLLENSHPPKYWVVRKVHAAKDLNLINEIKNLNLLFNQISILLQNRHELSGQRNNISAGMRTKKHGLVLSFIYHMLRNFCFKLSIMIHRSGTLLFRNRRGYSRYCEALSLKSSMKIIFRFEEMIYWKITLYLFFAIFFKTK